MGILNLIEKTYLDSPYYLIHSVEAINLPNISKVLPVLRSFPTLLLWINTQPYQS